MRARTATTFLAAALGIALGLAPGKAMAITADYTRTPVLMIHGYFVVENAGTATWTTIRKNLIDDGWPEEYLFTPSFRDVRGCNEEHIEEIEAWVENVRNKTGSERIDIVCHSFGCLNTLTWLKAKCGVNRVRQYVGLAGAVHGTVVACVDRLLGLSCAGKQMCISVGENGWKENELIVNANACDETPGDVGYTSIWSEWDEIIMPQSGSVMAGARNIEVETAGIEHGGIFLTDEPYGYLRTALLEGGLNDDGPSWACLPDCIPPEVADPPPEEGPEGTEGVTDEASTEVVASEEAGEMAETGAADVPEIEAAPDAPDLPTIPDGAATDPDREPDAADAPAADATLAEASPPEDGPVDPAPGRKASGCATGLATGASAPILLLLAGLLGIATRRPKR